jgi:hypothetical protein
MEPSGSGSGSGSSRMNVEKKASSSTREPETGGTTSAKRKKLEDLHMNEKLMNPELQKALQEAWTAGESFKDDNGLIEITRNPFLHAEINNFIEDKEVLESLVTIMVEGTIFQSKASDLFQFEQSDDLKSLSFMEVEGLRLGLNRLKIILPLY